MLVAPTTVKISPLHVQVQLHVNVDPGKYHSHTSPINKNDLVCVLVNRPAQALIIYVVKITSPHEVVDLDMNPVKFTSKELAHRTFSRAWPTVHGNDPGVPGHNLIDSNTQLLDIEKNFLRSSHFSTTFITPLRPHCAE